MELLQRTWKVLCASVQGASHKASGVPCQDRWATQEFSGPHEQFLILSCADGAGSASHAEHGAQAACAAFLRAAIRELGEGRALGQFRRVDALAIFREALLAIDAEAERLHQPADELATTLLGAVVGDSDAMFFQIGDGAMVVRQGGTYRPVFWPYSGEYADSTVFVTSSRAGDLLSFEVRHERVEEIALFTDGLERLLLRFAERAAHAPFFEPVFRSLREAPSATELQEPFERLLESPRVNDRTNDDKTLLLATRLSPDHACRNDL